MKKKTKRLLVNISFILFMINAVSALTVTAFIININILGIYWMVSAALVPVLLIISSVSRETKDEKDDTNPQDYAPKDNLAQKISAKVWSWIFSSTSKMYKIVRSYKVATQIPKSYKATDNHSFHIANLSEHKSPSQPNQNDTLFQKTIPPLFSKGRGINEVGLINTKSGAYTKFL